MLAGLGISHCIYLLAHTFIQHLPFERHGLGQGWQTTALGQINPQAVLVRKDLLENSHVQLFAYHLRLPLSYIRRINSKRNVWLIKPEISTI